MTKFTVLTLAAAVSGVALLSPLRSQPPPGKRPEARGAAQPQPAPAPILRSGTRLVQVDVVVRDKDGPITGLKKEDFTLLDQGQKQEIALFEANSSGGEASGSEDSGDHAAKIPAVGGISNRTDPSGKPIAGVTVLLLDQLNTFFEKQGYARAELLKYLDSAPAGDRIAVFLLGRELSVVQDFSDNPATASQAVKTWNPKQLFVMLENAVDMGATDQAVGDDPVYAEIRQRITSEAIAKIAGQLSAMPGRKNLIWISDRPGLTGVQFLAQANIHLYPVLARAVGPSGIAAWLRETREGGLRTPPPPGSGDEIQREHANSALAAANGGVAFMDSRDISLAIKTAREDTENGYTLAFYAKEDQLDNRFHPLTVRVGKTGAVRDKTFEVLYRPGYFASRMAAPAAANASAASIGRPAPPRETLEQLLKDPLDISQVEVTAEAAPDPARPDSLQIKVKIDPRDLALVEANGTRSGLVNVSFSVGGSGKAITKVLKVNIPDGQYDAFVESGIETVESIETAAGAQTLRVVVQDGTTGAAGSVTVPIEKR